MNFKNPQKEALDYVEIGWSVIPLQFKDKRPLIEWKEFQNRKAEADEVKGWFRRWPETNLGIVTGVISGLVVIDVDPQHEGKKSLAKLEKKHGPLPPTIESLTGGGGQHLYFSHPGIRTPNKAGLEPGIDIRGDGGYIVAPPSLHPSGKHYRWVKGHDPKTISAAQLPDWLLHDLKENGKATGHPMSYWRRVIREGVPQGERNNTIASITGHLLWHGIDPDVVMELLLCWNEVRCCPPLSNEEVIRTVESITHRHEGHGEGPVLEKES
jgi:hypothetical protein